MLENIFNRYVIANSMCKVARNVFTHNSTKNNYGMVRVLFWQHFPTFPLRFRVCHGVLWCDDVDYG